MNKLFIVFSALIVSASLWAQSPETISYQAVINDSNGKAVSSSTIGMRISILQGSNTGAKIYVENHTPTSSPNGLVSIEIGNGSVQSGDFASINWADGTYFVETETDPTGGDNYTITGISQLLSVPYALHAKTADSVIHIDYEHIANTPDLSTFLSEEVDGSVTNEIELPEQTGNSGKYLTTDGTHPSWETLDGAASTLNDVSDGVIETKSGALVMARLTSAERDSISDPVAGMMIYNSDLGKFQGYTSIVDHIVENTAGANQTTTEFYFGNNFSTTFNGKLKSIKLKTYQGSDLKTIEVCKGQFQGTNTKLYTGTFTELNDEYITITFPEAINIEKGKNYYFMTNSENLYFGGPTEIGSSIYVKESSITEDSSYGVHMIFTYDVESWVELH